MGKYEGRYEGGYNTLFLGCLGVCFWLCVGGVLVAYFRVF